MKKRTSLLTIALATLSTGTLAFGQTVLVGPDDFSSGTTNGNGYYYYNSHSAGVNWTVESGEVTNSAGAAANSTLFKSFTSTTINLNESFTVNASFRNNQTTTIGGTMELSLFNIGSQITANNAGGTDPRTGRTGLGLLQSLAEGGTRAAQYTGSGTTFTLGTGNNDQTGLYNTLSATSGFTSTQSIAGGGSLVDISLTYEIDSTGLLMSGTVGGNNIAWRIDGVTTFTADTLYLRGSYDPGDGSRFSRFDDISVSVIPEPGSFALLGGVLALGLVALRRRR